MNVLRRLSLFAGATPHTLLSRMNHMGVWGVESRKLAICGLIIVIAFSTAAMSYAVRVGAPVSLECKYYYTEEGGSSNSATTGCEVEVCQ